MATEVIMPKAGMSMEEGTMVQWFKKEGDEVQAGEALFEITTDKVNMEVEAEVSGTLIKVIAQEGRVLPVFTPIAYIGEAGEKVSNDIKKEQKIETVSPPKEKKEKTTPEIEPPSDTVEPQKIRATPISRKLAREHDLELKTIKGTGPKGRIQKIDVISYKEQKQKENSTPLAKRIAELEGVNLSGVAGSGHNGKVIKKDVLNLMAPKESSTQKTEGQRSGKIIPLTPMRQVISKRMTDSFFAAPTFTLNIEVNMEKAIEMRSDLKNIIEEETGYKLTITDIIILACAKTLPKHPMINASIVKEGILLHDHVSIALAVGLDEGLLVPVIKDADKMSLKEIASTSKILSSKAVNMKLMPSEQEGSTFTISNLGMYGISYFNPIINQPNSAILGVSAIIERSVVIEGAIQIKPMMNMSMTIDHRVIDGTPGAKFLYELKQSLENPTKLLI